jgi:hypothetical protein
VFDTDWVPRHLVEYFKHSTDANDLLAGRWLYWKLIEYQETGTNTGFDPDNDQMVSHYKLYNCSWSIFQVSEFTNTDGTIVHSVCSSLNGPQPRPDMTLCVDLSQGSTTVRGIREDPNALKWNVTIANYPYLQTNTFLALKFSFSTRMIVHDFNATDASQFSLDQNENASVLCDDGNGNKIIAGYVKTVNTTGAGCSPSAPVVRSIIMQGEWASDVDLDFPSGDPDDVVFLATKMVGYFSYISDCQPTSISWDPQIGAGLDPDSAAGVVFPSLMLALIALAANFL